MDFATAKQQVRLGGVSKSWFVHRICWRLNIDYVVFFFPEYDAILSVCSFCWAGCRMDGSQVDTKSSDVSLGCHASINPGAILRPICQGPLPGVWMLVELECAASDQGEDTRKTVEWVHMIYIDLLTRWRRTNQHITNWPCLSIPIRKRTTRFCRFHDCNIWDIHGLEHDWCMMYSNLHALSANPAGSFQLG